MSAVYGAPPQGLAEAPPGAVQVSPLSPGAGSLEQFAEGSLGAVVMSAPPGTLERRHELAAALQALRPGAILTAVALKDRGGTRLRKDLEGFGCVVEESAKRHHRICTCERPGALFGIAQALSEGAPRLVEALSLWSQPGVFSWDRLDPGSALLSKTLPSLSGRGAELGCGLGYLALTVLRSPEVERLSLIDIDRRAVEAARRNIDDPRVDLQWADVAAPDLGRSDLSTTGGDLRDLDFVVMNPPFHEGGVERRELGQIFIRRAAEALRKDGGLWLVANRHLPYEAVLASLFTRVEVKTEQGGYKVFEARR